jgi:hypothetical protein
LIPTKHQFQELQKACEINRLTASLNLIIGDVTESRIRAFIEGYDITLNRALFHYIYPLHAYQWLNDQQPFIMAQKKTFPDANETWRQDQISWVINQIDENLKPRKCSPKEKKAFLNNLMCQIAYKMQLRPYWIGMLSKCLCAYHYPTSPNMGKMREKAIEAGKKTEEALQTLLEITEFSEFMVGLPLPDQDLTNKMRILADILKPENVNELTPIKRADSSYMERLFVVQVANGHATHLGRNDGIPAVISDLFYLKGFANSLDERSVRRICTEQEQRRNKAEISKAQPIDNTPIGHLIAKK